MLILRSNYKIYKSFGLNGTSVYQIVALQTMIALAIDVIPVPGGIGFSESCFLVLFDKIFGEQLIVFLSKRCFLHHKIKEPIIRFENECLKIISKIVSLY